MSQTPRVMILDQNPSGMLAQLQKAMPGIEAVGCDSYEKANRLVPEFRPDVIFAITFAGRKGYPRAAIFGPGGPRWVAVGGSGVDHLGQWNPEKVTVTNCAGVAAPMMAEYAFGAMLHFTLDIPGLETDRAARRWDSTRLMAPLRGKTMLIVGLGHTGQAMAARAQAFGMRVIGTRATPREMAHVDEVHASAELPGLWPQADVVVLSVPLLDSTRGLVDARAFAAMKESAILINVSRGGVVDEDALVNALQGGAIRAAAMDVFATEPLPPDSPLWRLDNIIISPHASAVFDGWEMAMFDMFLGNLRRWRAGEPLENVVDPARGY